MPALIAQREGFAFQGRPSFYVVDFAEELKQGHRPACIDLPHPKGACPLGHKHRVEDHHLENLVVNGLYALILDHMIEASSPADLACTYIAAGTGASARNASMTALEAEYYRATWTERTRSGTSATFSWFFSTAVANTYLHEWGAFGGAATSTADSGTLFATWLWDFEKDATKTLNGDWVPSKA